MYDLLVNGPVLGTEEKKAVLGGKEGGPGDGGKEGGKEKNKK